AGGTEDVTLAGGTEDVTLAGGTEDIARPAASRARAAGADGVMDGTTGRAAEGGADWPAPARTGGAVGGGRGAPEAAGAAGTASRKLVMRIFAILPWPFDCAAADDSSSEAVSGTCPCTIWPLRIESIVDA